MNPSQIQCGNATITNYIKYALGDGPFGIYAAELNNVSNGDVLKATLQVNSAWIVYAIS